MGDGGMAVTNNDKIASDDVDIIQARLGLNWGLLLFSKSKFEEAIKIFSEVIDRCRNENMKNKRPCSKFSKHNSKYDIRN